MIPPYLRGGGTSPPCTCARGTPKIRVPGRFVQPLGGSPPHPLCRTQAPGPISPEKAQKKLYKMVQFRASGTVWASSYGRFTFQSLNPSREKEHTNIYKMVKFRASGMVWASSYGRFTFQSLGPICRERAQKKLWRFIQLRASETAWASSYGRITVPTLTLT